MKFFDKLVEPEKGDIPSQKNKNAEHAVILQFDYGIESDEPFYQLVGKLQRIIESNKLGRYDGHEMAMDNSDGSFYMYGPNAETLFKGIKEIVEQTDFMQGAQAYLRFGPQEEEVMGITVEITRE